MWRSADTVSLYTLFCGIDYFSNRNILNRNAREIGYGDVRVMLTPKSIFNQRSQLYQAIRAHQSLADGVRHLSMITTLALAVDDEHVGSLKEGWIKLLLAGCVRPHSSDVCPIMHLLGHNQWLMRGSSCHDIIAVIGNHLHASRRRDVQAQDLHIGYVLL